MSLLAYFNPYSDTNFGSFLVVMAKRTLQFAMGDLKLQDLAADEIQVLVLMGVACSAALVGTFLVLKKMTMLANALSHTILLGIVAAFLVTRQLFVTHQTYGFDFETILIASVATGLCTAFLTEFLIKFVRLQEDASIGLVFTSLFALGIILVSIFTRNSHIGTEVVMGNVDALQLEDLGLVWVVAVVNAFLVFVFFKEFQITTFDPFLAKAMGVSTLFFNYLLTIQVSATSIAAFRSVGVLMVLAFIVGPVLIARLITHQLKHLILLSIGVGMLASLFGVAISRHLLTVYGVALSTAGIIVCMIVVFYLVAILFSPQNGIISSLILRRKYNKIS